MSLNDTEDGTTVGCRLKLYSCLLSLLLSWGNIKNSVGFPDQLLDGRKEGKKRNGFFTILLQLFHKKKQVFLQCITERTVRVRCLCREKVVAVQFLRDVPIK